MDVLLSAGVAYDWVAPVVLASVALVIATYLLFGRTDIPPGPWGVPLLGYLPFMDKKPFLTLNRLAKQYGPLFSVRLGTRLIIVLNDYCVIKEAFVKNGKYFSGRPENSPFSEVIVNHHSGYYNEKWIELSKFLDKCLKDFGLGTEVVEMQILDEIDIFLALVKRKNNEAGGDPVTFRHELALSATNNACVMAFGRRFDYGDATFKSLKDTEDALIPLYDSVNWRFLFPFLNRIPGLSAKSMHSPLRKNGDQFKSFATHIVADHVTNPQKYRDGDFIFRFQQEQKKRLREKISLGAFEDTYLHGTLMALFGGGTQTVENTVDWAIILMLHHPQLQARIHLELDDVIGREKRVAHADRQRTPLTEATLMEVERFVSVVPINIPHSNTEEVLLRGYRIPKGSYVISNLYGAHHDPKKWIDPARFNPDRFLDGDKAVRPEHMIPFSIGKRSCPGESLAKMELYLYFASMMQHFQFLPVEGAPLPPLPLDIEYPGLVYNCPEFPVRLIPRF